MEEITTLPAIQPVMPKIEKQEFNFQWNHEEVKEYLISATEKYAGLVVTDENLKDMEKAKREITSIRTAIQKFQIRGKSELRKPVNVFDEQCKELLKVVNAVEAPLKEQLDKYETVRFKCEKMAQGVFMNYLIADGDDASGDRIGGIGSTGR